MNKIADLFEEFLHCSYLSKEHTAFFCRHNNDCMVEQIFAEWCENAIVDTTDIVTGDTIGSRS